MGFSPSFFVLPFVLIHDARLAFRTLDSFNLGNRGTSCNVVALLDVSESIFVYLAANRKTPFGHWRNSNILYYFCQTTPLLSSKENWNTAIENPPKSLTFDHFCHFRYWLYFFCFCCLEQITDSSPLVRLRLHAWWGKSEERTPQKFVICLQMVLTGSLSCRYAFPLPCEFIQ